MPLLDSFKVDHTKMNAPFVRIVKTMLTPNNDSITVYDLRFTAPNKSLFVRIHRVLYTFWLK